MSLANLFKAGDVAAEMTRRRNLLRDRYGAKYASRVGKVKRLVNGFAASNQLGILEAGLEMCKTAVLDGHGGAVNSLCAAAVDMVEEQGAAAEVQ